MHCDVSVTAACIVFVVELCTGLGGTALMVAVGKGNMGNEADPAWSQCEHHQQGNTTHFVLCVCNSRYVPIHRELDCTNSNSQSFLVVIK